MGISLRISDKIFKAPGFTCSKARDPSTTCMFSCHSASALRDVSIAWSLTPAGDGGRRSGSPMAIRIRNMLTLHGRDTQRGAHARVEADEDGLAPDAARGPPHGLGERLIQRSIIEIDRGFALHRAIPDGVEPHGERRQGHIARQMAGDEHDGLPVTVANIVAAIDRITGVEDEFDDGTQRRVGPEDGQAEGPERLADKAAGLAEWLRPERVPRATFALKFGIIRHSPSPLVARLAPARGSRRSRLRIRPSIPKSRDARDRARSRVERRE